MSDQYEDAVALVEGLIQQDANRIELRPGDGAYRLRTLIKVYEWAVDQQPFQVGARVTVNAGPFKPGHGFAPFNDVWLTRPQGTVESVEYNGSHCYWAFMVRLDARPEQIFSFGAQSLRLVEDDDGA